MMKVVRAIAIMLGAALLVPVLILYQTPVMGMVLSTTAFCQ